MSSLISANVCRPTLRGIGDTPPGESWFPLWMLSRHMKFSWDEKPDFLFYGDMGNGEHLLYPSHTIRIFLTGENIAPNWNEADYALTHERIWSERHWRVPLWRHWYDEGHTQVMRDFGVIRSRVDRFCNFIYSNDRATERIDFFHVLSQYKQVDAGGKVLNNIGGRVDDKRAYLARCKFTIAFENESHPGYATEKIIEPLLMGSIPIYWGDPHLDEDFNPDCFINVHRFRSYDDVIAEVQRIDQDDKLWENYVTAPIFRDGRLPEKLTDAAVMEFCRSIFEGNGTPIGHSRKVVQRCQQYFRIMGNSHRFRSLAGSIKQNLHNRVRSLLRLGRGSGDR
ncbi:MAG: glycosyltransferase family 10 [Planctomycetaceae bacterium]